MKERKKMDNRKYLVAGSGKSGIGAAELLYKTGAEVILYDGNAQLKEEDIRKKLHGNTSIQIILGDLTDEVLDQFDTMILSPGIAIDAPFVNKVRAFTSLYGFPQYP